MKIDILTLFPEMFDGFKSESIIKRAIDAKKVSINTCNLFSPTTYLSSNLKFVFFFIVSVLVPAGEVYLITFTGRVKFLLELSINILEFIVSKYIFACVVT